MPAVKAGLSKSPGSTRGAWPRRILDRCCREKSKMPAPAAVRLAQVQGRQPFACPWTRGRTSSPDAEAIKRGRASEGERVCRYVLFLVVAGIIKKKKINNKPT